MVIMCRVPIVGLNFIYVVVMFFFFQAEDGIRDIGVTGVQTCALPIFRGDGGARGRRFRPAGSSTAFPRRSRRGCAGPPAPRRRRARDPRGGRRRGRPRSGERRVGKEGRSRWAPVPLKKKKRINRSDTC